MCKDTWALTFENSFSIATAPATPKEGHILAFDPRSAHLAV